MDKNAVINYLKEREFPEEIKNNEIYLDKISSAITDMYIGKNISNVALELDSRIIMYENVRGFVVKKSDYYLQNDIENAGKGQTLDKESFVLQEDGLHIEKLTTSLIANDEVAIPVGVVEETTIDKNGVENVRTKTTYTGLESSLQTAQQSRITGLSAMAMNSTIEIRRNKDLGTAYVIETRNNNITAKDMKIDSSNINLLNVTTPYTLSSLTPEELETYYKNVENAISNISNPITRNSMQERLSSATNKQNHNVDKSFDFLTPFPLEGDKMSEEEQKRVNDSLRELQAEAPKKSNDSVFDRYTNGGTAEVGGIVGLNSMEDSTKNIVTPEYPEGIKLPQPIGLTEKQADAMVEQMSQGVDVLGENQNRQEVSNGKQMGFTAIWLLGLVTGIVSAGILILGAVLLK